MNAIRKHASQIAAVFVALAMLFICLPAWADASYAYDGQVALIAAETGDTASATGDTGSADLGAGTAGEGDTRDASAPPSEEQATNADVKVQARVKGAGWKKAVQSGATAGTTKKKPLIGLKAELVDRGGAKGTLNYRVYAKAGWTVTAKNGAATKTRKKPASAVRMWLSGPAKKSYDVYYRVHLQECGWLDWAHNKQVAGTTSLSNRITAIQVKLVKKGDAIDGDTATPRLKSRWDALEFKYRSDAKVTELLEVRYLGGVRATVAVRKKSGRTWKTALSCSGYVGRAGIGRAREWVARTPEGDFGITSAFGINGDPGANLPYVQVTQALYWCGDRSYYNQLINIYEHPHDCDGEHLIDYAPHYNYGLFFDYNTNPVRYGAGSAFFVHCTGPGSASGTGGCIAISQPNMIKVIRLLHYGARVCIYPK